MEKRYEAMQEPAPLDVWADRVDAATLAAEMRPLVLAMTQKVYNQDPESFEALARDVRASLLVLPPDNNKRLDLQALLEAKMNEAEKHRPSWSV